MRQYVFSLRKARAVRSAGNKAKSLRFLARHGFQVPVTYVCISQAHQDHLEGSRGLLHRLRSELSGLVLEEKSYAVRSSADVEDGELNSFAGQFSTVLGVQGVDGVLDAIQEVWDSAHSDQVRTYMRMRSGEETPAKMAVLIQEMVTPMLSGVAFSQDPLTGSEAIVVEAVKGSGDALVQKGSTPYRWVRRGEQWAAQPDSTDVPEGVISNVVRQTKRIAEVCGYPVDLEWVWDGEGTVWVQLRRMLPVATPDVYSNRISREFLPGMIKPLVWSVNVPLVNGAWVWLLTEMAGPNDIDPSTLAKAFHYRAYFNMGVVGRIFELLGFRKDSLELLMGVDRPGDKAPRFRPTPRSLILLPRLLRFLVDKLRFSGRVLAFVPGAKAEYADILSEVPDQTSDGQWLDRFDRSYSVTQQVAYYNIVVKLMADLYSHLLRRCLRPLGIGFEQLDMSGAAAGLGDHDPMPHLQRLRRTFLQLDTHLQEAIRCGGMQGIERHPEAGEFEEALTAFTEQFGHLKDSGNDFSTRSWREMPDTVLQMVVSGPETEAKSGEHVSLDSLRLPWVRRSVLTWLYLHAKEFIGLKEAVGSLNTLGFDVIRRCFTALGTSFVHQGLLEEEDDIFYLGLEEIRAMVVRGEDAQGISDEVRRRKSEMGLCADIDLPSVIYGDEAPPIVSRTRDVFEGVATSPGRYTGHVKVVLGIQEFPKLEQGEIAVVAHSDVAWTPLFAKAGAVIAESGGILSHSSIVAREFGIPAVVSVEGACRLRDGTLVTVDGYQGKVSVHD